MGVFGFFISIDLFTMFMFYEVAFIPMYLLIGVWGSGRKEYAAMKADTDVDGRFRFPAYRYSRYLLRFGSNHHEPTRNSTVAQHTYRTATHLVPADFPRFRCAGRPFPFHTWSPDGHASAPTAVSMLHAGVLMKLGGYGCFRIAMYLMPEAAKNFGLDIPDTDRYLCSIRCILRLCTDRLEVYQCLLFRISLRTGAFRHPDAEPDS